MISVYLIIVVIIIAGGFYHFRKRKVDEVIKYKLRSVVYNFDLEELLFIINQHRLKIGLKSVIAEATLTEIAKNHCDYMVLKKEPSHEGFSDRAFMALSLGFKNAIEVVSFGYATNEGLLKAYLRSPEHKKAIESPKVNYVGIGKVEDDENRSYNTIFFCLY